MYAFKYYDRIFDSKNVIISVNGNVEADKLVSEFGSIFKNKKIPIKRDFCYISSIVSKQIILNAFASTFLTKFSSCNFALT